MVSFRYGYAEECIRATVYLRHVIKGVTIQVANEDG